MNMKRLVSLLLAFAMVFVMVIPPSQVHAKGDDEFVEADYKVENVDGKSYKVYKFTDLVGTSESNGQFEVDGLEVSEPRMLHPVGGSNPALGEEIPNADSYAVDVKWTTYDLAPENLGTPVYFQIVDDTTDKVIAQTENVNGKEKSKKYKFYKLPAWDDSGVSHNPVDWLLQAPNEYKFDVRLRTSTQGSGEDSNFQALISQRGMPIYRAEYYTNKAIPKIKVQRTNKADDTDEVSINTENLTGDQYYSWARAISDQQKPYFEGRLLDIQKYGQDTLMSLQISDNITAGRVKMAMKAPGKTKFDRGPGTFTDNGTPYHYEVTGDYLHIHIFTIRQDLKVKFDANGGTWKNTAPADQTIGHSMKLADSWAGLGPINVPGAGDLTPPTVAAGKPEKEFIGWNTDANASTALFTDNTYVTPITKDETFYAIYVEKPQGKVQVKYLDDSNAEIQAKYKYISDKAGEDEIKEGTTTKKLNLDEKYPSEKPGNKGETIKQELLNTSAAPTFIGYKIKQVKTNPVPNPPETAKYTETGEYTIQYIYEKLDPIIPAKDDNGGNNPKATEDVKATYKSVTIKVDGDKGQFKKNSGVVNGTEFVYYVNPVEGKTLQEVLTASGLTAESKDANVYKIDTAKPWKFDPAKTKANADVATSTEVTNTNFDKKNIDMKVNFVQTKADQLKDKLVPVDIRVWVNDQDTDGSKITWKEGVKLNDANKDNETLKGLLAGATVTDLGENGTLTQEGTKRNSSKQNLPDGKKGTLKVAFDDGSALAVENQKLYVAPHKNVVKPNEPNQINLDKLPDDKVEVQFKLGEGVKIGDKNGEKTNPVLYETFYVKPGTSLEDNDIPTTSLVDGYKDNKWYKGVGANAPAAVDNDYKNLTLPQDKKPIEFLAKAVEKGKGTVNVEYYADGTKLDNIDAYKLPGKTYITSKQGTEDAEVKATDLTNDYFDLLGYEKDTSKGTKGIEVEANTKYLTANPGTVKFNYKKIDDIVGPAVPGTNKPAGYVTIMFKADADNQNPARGNFGTNIQELVYYVNPKTVNIDTTTQTLSGTAKDGTNISKNFPSAIVTNDAKSVWTNLLENSKQKWDLKPTDALSGTKIKDNFDSSTVITLTALYKEKDKGSIEYSFKFFNSKKPNEELPASVVNGRFDPELPKSEKKNEGDEVTLPTFTDVKRDKDDKGRDLDLQGTWHFDGWYKASDANFATPLTKLTISSNADDNKLVGKWVLKETETKKVTREFVIDSTIVGAGKDVPTNHPLPQGVVSQKPNTTTNYIGSKQTPGKDKFNSVYEEINGKKGDWTFVKWDKAELTVNEDERKNVFTGTWTWTEKLVRPVDPNRPDKQDDEVEVKFLKGEHGTLSGIALVSGSEENVTGRDELAYYIKKKATWAAMAAYIPTAVADYGWSVANPSWKPVLPATDKVVEEATFTAQYAAKPTDRYITLTLDENYRGGRISDYDAYQGALIEGYLYRPHRRGYVFEGWSYNSRRLDEVRPGDRIEYSTTLYAIWSKQKAKDDEEVEPIDTREVNEHKAYMFGYTDGTVRPNGYITRAEAAALVTRLLGLDTFASAAEPAFTDTPSSWYNKAINAAVNRGIMKGYPDKSFRPNAPITRAEFTQMISTIDNKPYGVAPFADVVGHWAERPIGSEYQAGRIKGYPDGTFRPNAFITRAEAVVILNKIFERNYDAMSAMNAKNKEYIKRFIDLTPSFWGFNDMVEATNTHLFKRRVKGAVQEDWVEVK